MREVDIMDAGYTYYIVSARVLPEAMRRTAEAKRLLRSGEAKTAAEAAKLAGISRSVFYKYKDDIRPYYDQKADKHFTIYALLEDRPGILSAFLSVLAQHGANILTINQNIPVNGFAPITVSIRTEALTVDLPDLLSRLSALDGVANTDLLGME